MKHQRSVAGFAGSPWKGTFGLGLKRTWPLEGLGFIDRTVKGSGV